MRVARVFVVLLFAVLVGPATTFAQKNDHERTFPQSKAAVQRALNNLRTSGRLPTLDGFVDIGTQPAERFQRPYYECAVRVTSATAGATVVRVAAKITAWYSDPGGAKSGYELLPSNGRLEADLLDQLADALGTTGSVTKPANKSGQPEPTISAPTPQRPDDLFSRNLSGVARSQARLGPPNAESTDARVQQLRKEAQNLQDILNHQSRPNNLVAVKNSATPVLAFPRMDSKVLFYASAQDEFEILDLTADWVHVRISGLSRGWIRRSQLEMPEAIGDAGSEAVAAGSAGDAAEPFRVTSEETAPFPGNWEPLRGKTVKIISVIRPDQMVSNPQMKLAYAKAVFDKEYPELSHHAPSLAGVMVIFDSADGGMMAATMASLQQWKAGALSDDALWDKCYFDPPETFAHNSTASR